MIKRLFAAFSAAALLLFCGCASGNGNDGRLQIVTTIFPAYDFARQIFGDKADITLLLKPGMESHSYDPSARDIVKIDKCDLFIYNGGESDEWVESLLKSAEEINYLRMMSFVEALEEEELIGVHGTEEHDHSDDGDEEYDEHIWTSPKNAILITEGITNEAKRLDSANAAYYAENAAGYSDKLSELDERFTRLFKDEKRYFVFGDRFPLLYFFKEYGLNYYAAFPGCGAETEPSAQTVAFLTERLKSDDTLDTVFYIELSNHKLAENLAAENGLETAEFHTCHNISADDFENGETYLSLMERNFRTLENIVNDK